MLPDIDALSSYNGAVNGTLVDYSPVENPNTDIPAAGMTAMMGSVAMMTGMAARAYCTFTYASGSSAPVNEHNALWGNAPAVIPVIARTAAGTFTAMWPATVADAIGNIHSINLRRGWCNIEAAAATVLIPYVSRTSANVMQIVFVNGTGVATDPTNIAVDVFVL